jgi:hypothetical protein
MSTQSPEIQAKLSNLRQRAAAGTMTLDEAREAIRYLREGRYAAQAAEGAKGGKRAKGPVKSADEMLGELGL